MLTFILTLLLTSLLLPSGLRKLTSRPVPSAIPASPSSADTAARDNDANLHPYIPVSAATAREIGGLCDLLAAILLLLPTATTRRWGAVLALVLLGVGVVRRIVRGWGGRGGGTGGEKAGGDVDGKGDGKGQGGQRWWVGLEMVGFMAGVSGWVWWRSR